jgi:hypothetical protein
MRAIALLLTAVLLTACAPKEEEAPPPPPPAAPTVADFAGTWNVASVLEGTPDTVRSTLAGTADATSWTMTLEGRPNIPVTVSVVGDSLVGQSAEYESILRKGVMVSVRTASVLTNGTLTGNLVATYKSPTGEEVVRGTMTATKGM